MAGMDESEMNAGHAVQEADLLERYWQHLATDPDAPRPPGLAPEVATLSRRLHVDALADDPSTETLARLARRIDAGMPSPATAPAAAPRRSKRAWRWWSPRAAAAGFAAVSLVGVLLLVGVLHDGEDGGAIRAAEILRAARAAAGLSDAVPLDTTELESIADAQELATFVVRTPTQIPQRFELDAIAHQRWPYADDGVHADFVLMTYRDPDGRWLEIWQGFTAPYLSFESLAPEGRTGLLRVEGKDAVWIEGRPIDHDGAWDPEAQTALGILEGRQNGSPRFTVLASDDLTVEELVAIAESLK